MTTSGSVDFSVSRDNLITEACQAISVVEEGGTANANQLSDGARLLNMLVKNWVKYGLQLWAQEEIIVFPIKDQKQYTLGSGGSRSVLVGGEVLTQLNGDHASAATSLTVDSTTSMATSDIIGVQTTAGGIHWTTISTIPSSTTLTIASGLSGAAADNKRVYTYTTAWAQRPLRVISARTVNEDDTSIPVIVTSRQEYEYLSDQTTTGRPNQVFYDPQLGSGLLNIWPIYDDANTNQLLYLTVHRVFEDFDATGDTPDFPQEWYLPLMLNLALLLTPKYGCPELKFRELQILAKDALDSTLDWDTEQVSLFLSPDMG